MAISTVLSSLKWHARNARCKRSVQRQPNSADADGPEAAYYLSSPCGPAAQLDARPLLCDRTNKLENPSMRFLSAFTASLFCSIPSLSFANCFSIYSPQGQLVFRSTVAPIDLSLPITEGLRVRFPNHHLVFLADESGCTDISVKSYSRTDGAFVPGQKRAAPGRGK